MKADSLLDSSIISMNIVIPSVAESVPGGSQLEREREIVIHLGYGAKK